MFQVELYLIQLLKLWFKLYHKITSNALSTRKIKEGKIIAYFFVIL
jgi:hypothetical protein